MPKPIVPDFSPNSRTSIGTMASPSFDEAPRESAIPPGRSRARVLVPVALVGLVALLAVGFFLTRTGAAPPSAAVDPPRPSAPATTPDAAPLATPSAGPSAAASTDPVSVNALPPSRPILGKPWPKGKEPPATPAGATPPPATPPPATPPPATPPPAATPADDGYKNPYR